MARTGSDDRDRSRCDLRGDPIHVRSLEDYYRRRKHGHVADLVVAEGYEGQGIATALLGRAEEWALAQGYDWMTLGVFEQNARAEQLYQKFGFRRDVIRLLKPLT
jgi:GNAT superfamily N-acetyltransferase